MSEKLDIHIEDVIVRTEDNTDVAEFLNFTFSNHFEPCIIKTLMLELKLNVFKTITNHILIIKFANLQKSGKINFEKEIFINNFESRMEK